MERACGGREIALALAACTVMACARPGPVLVWRTYEKRSAADAEVHLRVTDEVDGALVGLAVELKAGTKVRTATITDAAGQAALRGLGAGRYTLRVSYPKTEPAYFLPATIKDINLNPGDSVRFRIRLRMNPRYKVGEQAHARRGF